MGREQEDIEDIGTGEQKNSEKRVNKNKIGYDKREHVYWKTLGSTVLPGQ